MSKIVMASNNRHKIKEIETFLHELCPFDKDGKPFEILSLSDIGYTDDIVEDGETFEDNALIKARTVAKLGYIGIADDSGLCVDALNGAPGVYSARYAGGHDDADNNRLILKNLKDVPAEKCTLRFRDRLRISRRQRACCQRRMPRHDAFRLPRKRRLRLRSALPL